MIIDFCSHMILHVYHNTGIQCDTMCICTCIYIYTIFSWVLPKVVVPQDPLDVAGYDCDHGSGHHWLVVEPHKTCESH